MRQYIEVNGEAAYTERVRTYRAEIRAGARNAARERAAERAMELRNRCINALREAGIDNEAIQEGGASHWQTYPWKRNTWHESTNQILVQCDDATRLHEALMSLEALAEGKELTVSVSMLPPRFEAEEGARDAALREALADARAKAEVLAAAARVALGAVRQIEELEKKTGRSGSYGDEDWGSALFDMAVGAPAEAPEPLEKAVRENTLRLRVRYAIESEGS